MSELTLTVRIAIWRRVGAWLWLRLAMLCELTLPGSIDEDVLRDDLVAFLMRGLRVSLD